MGTAYVNGQYDAETLYSRDAGRTWHKGVGTTQAQMSNTDTYMRRTEWAAFRSPANGGLEMKDVAALPGGWLAAGTRTDVGDGGRPVIWQSRDGRQWGGQVDLPVPDGVYAARIDHLAAQGRTVVAVGSFAETENTRDYGTISWVSRDGGRTWSDPEVVGKSEVSVNRVLALPRGFLAVGDEGKSGTEDASAWVSRDGTDWQQVDLGLERGAGPGKQTLVAALVDGKRLRLVGSDVPPAGGGDYVATVPLPTS